MLRSGTSKSTEEKNDESYVKPSMRTGRGASKVIFAGTSDWDNLSRLAGEELYKIDSQYVQPVELLKTFELIQGASGGF